MTDTSRKTDYDSDYRTVAAHYQSVAVETTPDELNRSVLNNAAKAARENSADSWRWSSWRQSWLRPLSFAATIGLSLALVMQVGNFRYSGVENITTEHSGTQPNNNSAANDFDSAAVAAMEQIRAAEEAARQSPGESESVEIPGSTLEQARAEQLRLEQLSQGNRTADPAPTTNTNCSAEQRATTTSWWQCIELLESRGLTDAATMEIKALYAAHPAFGKPE